VTSPRAGSKPRGAPAARTPKPDKPCADCPMDPFAPKK
jgi:hypothetical protein